MGEDAFLSDDFFSVFLIVVGAPDTVITWLGSQASRWQFKALVTLASIAWQTILFVSELLAVDKKVTPDLTRKQ